MAFELAAFGDGPAVLHPDRMNRDFFPLHCNELIESGAIIDQSELARFGQMTTARSEQIMSLLALAPDIQEAILSLPRTQAGRDAIKEHEVRSIAATLDWRKQRRMWADLRKRGNSNG